MRGRKFIFMMLVALLVLGACSTAQINRMSWEQKATLAYVDLGETLLSVHNQIEEICPSIDSGSCVKAKKIYNQAADIYTTAGTMLKVAVSIDDPKRLESYAGLIDRLQTEVLPELTLLIKKYLVKEVSGGG